MPIYSACIEMLFAKEDVSFGDRIRQAADAGFQAVEFWRFTNKDLNEIEKALEETGLALTALVAEPMIWLTDPQNHAGFLEGLERTVSAASRLGAPIAIAQAGNVLPGVSRADQQRAIIDCLSRAADVLEGSGVTLALEPLNDRVDHPGYYLTSTVEGLDIVDAVGRPEIRLLYDIYHSGVMGEITPDVIGNRLDRIVHIHLADHPGRHEPGSGSLDWQDRLNWLITKGYTGNVGLEYKPLAGHDPTPFVSA